MNRAFTFVGPLLVCSAVASTGQTSRDAAEPMAPPSPIEQAVVEHRCNAGRTSGIGATDEFQVCLQTQLRSLRTDFGIDLKRLADAERRTLDSACSRVRAAEGRDAYVACISNQLWTLHNRRAAAAPPAPAASPAPTPAPLPSEAPRDPPRSNAALLGGAAVVVLMALAGGIVAVRQRRVVSR